MTGWQTLRLGQVLKAPLVNGRSVPTRQGGFPVLRLTALRDGGVDLRERKEGAWTKEDAERFLVSRSDFLVARGNGSLDLVGRGALVDIEPDEVAFPDTMIRVTLDQEVVLPRFLSLVWNSPTVRSQIESVARTTAGIYKVNQRQLEVIRLPVPDLEEQRRIVDILDDHISRLDAAEIGMHASATRLEALWLSTLMEARAGLLEFPRTTIGAAAETSLGKMLDSKRQTGILTPYLRNINVRWGAFDLDDIQSTPLTAAEIERLGVRPGDIMVCEGGEPGRCAVWKDTARKVAFQKALHRVRVRDTESLLPEFLALMLTESIRSGRSDGLFTGTTIKHLPQEKLRVIELPLPPTDMQLAALTKAADLRTADAHLRSELEATRRRSAALRRALLVAAFAGRLTGKSSDPEVAEEMVAV